MAYISGEVEMMSVNPQKAVIGNGQPTTLSGCAGVQNRLFAVEGVAGSGASLAG